MTEPRHEPEPDPEDRQPPAVTAHYDAHTSSPLVDRRLFEDLI